MSWIKIQRKLEHNKTMNKLKFRTVDYWIEINDQSVDRDVSFVTETDKEAIELAENKIPRGRKFKVRQ